MITAAPDQRLPLGRHRPDNKSIMITHARPEYSSGATLAAGACLNASVMPHCPMAPVIATPRISR